MAKKTKKNNVVKKTVKAKKAVKASKPNTNKKSAAKAKTKSAKPVTAKKKISKPAKSAKPAPSKKSGKAKPAIAKKGNVKKTIVKKAAKKTVKNIKAAVKTVKSAAKKAVKTVKKSTPAKAQKPVKATKPAKAAKAVKNGSAKKTQVSKPQAKVQSPARKAEAPKKAEAQKVNGKMNGKPAATKAEVKRPDAAPVATAPVKPLRKKRPESRPAPEFNEDGTPVKMVKLNGKGHHPEPSRVISAPVVAPKPVIMQAEKKKEPKGKFEMEYVIHASSELLFEFLTTPSGLSEWFADDVNIRQGIYTFFWDGAEQQAKLIGYREPKMARFQWADKNDGSYFEFRIEVDELTRDVSLIITDFAEDPAEQHTSKLLWDSQVNKLLHVIGAYY